MFGRSRLLRPHDRPHGYVDLDVSFHRGHVFAVVAVKGLVVGLFRSDKKALFRE